MKKVLNYQLNMMRIYYIILICCYLFATVFGGFVMWISTNSSEGELNGLEMMAFIYVFVIFISSYGENARFAMQNGSTRKEIFYATMLNLLISCAGFSAINQAGTLINGMVSNSSETIFMGMAGSLYGIDQGLFGLIFINFIFVFVVMAAIGMFGILLAVIFAKLGKTGRVMLAVGVPTSMFVLLPMVTGYLVINAPGFMLSIGRFLYAALGFQSNNPFIGSLTFVLGAGVMGVISYLVNRRIEVK